MEGIRRRLAWLRSSWAYTGSLHKDRFRDLFGISLPQYYRDRANFLEEVEQRTGRKPRVGKDGAARGPEDADNLDRELLLPPGQILHDVLGDRFVEASFIVRREPDQNVLRAVVQAVQQRRTLSVFYASAGKPPKRTTLMPHTLVEAEGRLHARARNDEGQFRDYVLARMSAPHLGEPHALGPADDPQWSKHRTIHVRVEDPSSPFAEGLIQEYGLDPATGTKDIAIPEALERYIVPLYEADRFGGGYPITITAKDG